jgi:hypothetical protein
MIMKASGEVRLVQVAFRVHAVETSFWDELDNNRGDE